MKKHIAAATLLAILVAVAGCQTAPRGPSDLEMVQGVTNTFTQGLVNKDVDAALTVVSENFYHADTGDKASLRNFLQGAIDVGYLDGAEVDLGDAQYTIEEARAEAYPVILDTMAGTATLGLQFTKTAGVWLVTGMQVEGV